MFNDSITFRSDPSRVYLLERVVALSTAKTKILDVGCGNCRLWGPLLGKYSIDLTGIDIDEASVKQARDMMGLGNNVKVGDAHALSQIFPLGYFNRYL